MGKISKESSTAEKVAQLSGEFSEFRQRVLSDSADMKKSIAEVNEKVGVLIAFQNRQSGTLRAVHWAGGLLVACIPTVIYAAVREIFIKK